MIGGFPAGGRARAIAIGAFAAVAWLAGGAGCVRYSGGARAVDPASIRVDAGWVVAGDTPVIRQRAIADCGAAALAMVAARWRVPLGLAEASVAAPAHEEGASLGELRAVARDRGLVAFVIAADAATLAHELGVGRPIIVGLLRPYGGRRVVSHYEVVVAMRAPDGDPAAATTSFATIDPGSGWQVRTWAQLDAEWKPAGRPALVVVGTAAHAEVGASDRARALGVREQHAVSGAAPLPVLR